MRNIATFALSLFILTSAHADIILVKREVALKEMEEVELSLKRSFVHNETDLWGALALGRAVEPYNKKVAKTLIKYGKLWEDLKSANETEKHELFDRIDRLDRDHMHAHNKAVRILRRHGWSSSEVMRLLGLGNSRTEVLPSGNSPPPSDGPGQLP